VNKNSSKDEIANVNLFTAIRYDTIRYGRLTCSQKPTRWSA